MNTPYRFAALALVGLAAATPALADNAEPRPADRTGDFEAIGADYLRQRQEMKARFDEARADIEMKRRAIRGAMQLGEAKPQEELRRPQEEGKGERETPSERKDAFMQASVERRAGFKAKLQALKEEVREGMASRKELMRERLQAFKDGGKADIAAKVDASLSAINERRVAFFEAAVDRIEDVLGIIVARADRAEQEGGDVAGVRARVTQAEDAIAAAREGIAEQAGYDYTVTVSEEAEIRADVKKERDALQEDLEELRELVRAAHQAVRAAADELKDVRVEASASVTSE